MDVWGRNNTATHYMYWNRGKTKFCTGNREQVEETLGGIKYDRMPTLSWIIAEKKMKKKLEIVESRWKSKKTIVYIVRTLIKRVIEPTSNVMTKI